MLAAEPSRVSSEENEGALSVGWGTGARGNRRLCFISAPTGRTKASPCQRVCCGSVVPASPSPWTMDRLHGVWTVQVHGALCTWWPHAGGLGARRDDELVCGALVGIGGAPGHAARIVRHSRARCLHLGSWRRVRTRLDSCREGQSWVSRVWGRVSH